jgi:nucleotide-binding universal stress UspA family protein
MAENLLVPLDGSEKAYDALAYAVDNHPEAEITVIHALDLNRSTAAAGSGITMDQGIREAAESRAEEIFAEAAELASDQGYEGDLSTVVEDGTPKQVIVEHATDFDAVVMGSYGPEGIGQKVLGSVAETVVRRSPVSVMVVK